MLNCAAVSIRPFSFSFRSHFQCQFCLFYFRQKRTLSSPIAVSVCGTSHSVMWWPLLWKGITSMNRFGTHSHTHSILLRCSTYNVLLSIWHPTGIKWDFFSFRFRALLLTFRTTALIDFLSFVSSKASISFYFVFFSFLPVSFSLSPPLFALRSLSFSVHWFDFIQSFVTCIVLIPPSIQFVHSFVRLFRTSFPSILTWLGMILADRWSQRNHYFSPLRTDVRFRFGCVLCVWSEDFEMGDRMDAQRPHWAYAISG